MLDDDPRLEETHNAPLCAAVDTTRDVYFCMPFASYFSSSWNVILKAVSFDVRAHACRYLRRTMRVAGDLTMAGNDRGTKRF
jgi:hypothetical protein